MSTRAEWLDKATYPERVEHVFGCDADDEVSLEATQGHRRVVSPAIPTVSAVRNWNACAVNAAGDVLVVIADDLLPPNGWDEMLDSVVARSDPQRVEWVISSKEHGADERVLIRHPIISAAYYRRFGLFDPRFRGVYCDDDFTMRAFSRSVVIVVPDLVYRHENRGVMREAPVTESFERLNAESEYDYGLALYRSLWSQRREAYVGRSPYPVRLIAPSSNMSGAAWRAVTTFRSAAARMAHIARVRGGKFVRLLPRRSRSR